MTNKTASFADWFKFLESYGKAMGWGIENQEDWRTHYDAGMTPEEAYAQEMT